MSEHTNRAVQIFFRMISISLTTMFLTCLTDLYAQNIIIQTELNVHPISPYIYGNNGFNDNSAANMTASRQGGNRLTSYNWENNASNSGIDWGPHNNDGYLAQNLPLEEQNIPGRVVTAFIEACNAKKQYSLVTLQMAGYVAADKTGLVSDPAPNERWKTVTNKKGAPLSLIPDLTNEYVYMDELINLLISEEGTAGNGGANAYSIDNEPGLWASTHPLIHPDNVTVQALISNSVALATVIKDMDSDADVFGPALYGYYAYFTLQNAPDWSIYSAQYDWFISAYLDEFREASQTTGHRLLDVLDLHWYPEARGGGTRITDNSTSEGAVEARLQAPRSLWDDTYIEDSWIASGSPINLIPRLLTSINTYYPGTGLAFTEWYYGAATHISGGLAAADVLGVFGAMGVFFASPWYDTTSYVQSAFQLYRNYDGKNATFGDISVDASTDEDNSISVVAALNSSDNRFLYTIVINKTETNRTCNFSLIGPHTYYIGEVYGFDSTGTNITQRISISNITSNTFAYTIPALSAMHIILSTDSDDDLLADAWEYTHTTNLTTLSGRDDRDTDGDGATDLHEYYAETNPTNAASYFSLSVSNLPNSKLLLSWASISNKTYAIENATTLTQSWESVTQGIIATPPQNIHTVQVQKATSFYRLKLTSDIP